MSDARACGARRVFAFMVDYGVLALYAAGLSVIVFAFAPARERVAIRFRGQASRPCDRLRDGDRACGGLLRRAEGLAAARRAGKTPARAFSAKAGAGFAVRKGDNAKTSSDWGRSGSTEIALGLSAEARTGDGLGLAPSLRRSTVKLMPWAAARPRRSGPGDAIRTHSGRFSPHSSHRNRHFAHTLPTKSRKL